MLSGMSERKLARQDPGAAPFSQDFFNFVWNIVWRVLTDQMPAMLTDNLAPLLAQQFRDYLEYELGEYLLT
jgi:hypothetical protein